MRQEGISQKVHITYNESFLIEPLFFESPELIHFRAENTISVSIEFNQSDCEEDLEFISRMRARIG